MEELFYEMIFKRKSFHLFRETGKISSLELKYIEDKFRSFKPLIDDIKVDIKIVPAEETTCKRGQEYCILLYSEQRDNYLQNIGYIGEQLDLYLSSLNIGSLWFGIGKTQDIKYNGLDFVIMIAIAKMEDDKFRKDMFKSKRKSLAEIWSGEECLELANIVRFAPSACNTQPWIVESSKDKLTIFRYKKPGKRGIMPVQKVTFYNRIDIGIFLLFIEICLKHENINYERSIYIDSSSDDQEKTLVAIYNLNKDKVY